MGADWPPVALYRRWARVPEEEAGGPDRDRRYRPADQPLPPARGRDGIEFHPDGSYQRWWPGPADAPVGSAPGRWTAPEPGRLRLCPPGDPTGPGVDVRVVSVTEDLLRLRWPDPG